MPEEAILWNSLATVLAEDGRVEESLVFYRGSDPASAGFRPAWHNLGYAFSHLGRLEEALAAYDSALARSASTRPSSAKAAIRAASA